MRYTTTPRFDKDYKAVPREHRRQFTDLMVDFSAACDAYCANPAGYTWPKSLRVSPMTSVNNIWEMTWSFASPDGRATFEFITHNGETSLLWRRIGSHAIYQKP